MACNSDHMNPMPRELKLSKIECLLDELEGQKIISMHWQGYHPRVYNTGCSVDNTDKLCRLLKTVDVSKYSLEMQMWWRDHQEADQARMRAERKAMKLQRLRLSAMSKLTNEERKALGL